MSSKKGIKFYKRTDVKITLWYILTFIVTTIIIFSFMYIRIRHHLIKEIDRFLKDELREFSFKVSETSRDFKWVIKEYEEDIVEREYYPIYFRVLNTDGTVVATSKNFAEIIYPIDQEKLRNIGGGTRYIETVKVPGRKTPFRILSSRLTVAEKFDCVVQIGTRMESIRKSLGNFSENILTAIPIALVLGTIGGWLLARRSLAPIAYITEATKKITATNLGERLRSRQSDDELDHLIATINAMIARLEESFKRMNQLTADVSHELRTPISAMRGEAELLLSKPRPTGEYRRALATYIEQLDFLTRLIDDLILLSKFDSNEARLTMIPIKLDKLLINLGEFFRALAEHKGIKLTAGKMKHATVVGDQTRLQQLFTNLIDNAIKFTPSGGRIDIALQKERDVAKVSIKDTGIGIPSAESEHIFERFYQVDKSRDKERGGVGLGLSICQWIATAHHGNIEVKSEVGKGSRFAVSLPLMTEE
ncbi:MAG: HAMP domain-containing protein [Deltaproteobacteria bacterium]|nr:HAMP domain-containing protein [Deltaproteobacteria bacterium]